MSIDLEMERDSRVAIPELSPSVIEALDQSAFPPLLRTKPSPCGLVEVASVTMGGGKTRAVEVLAEQLNGRAVAQFERWQENPYLTDPVKRFSSETWFLMAKIDDNKRLNEYPPQQLAFQDQPLEGDYLFAPVDQAIGALTADELKLYQRIYGVLAPSAFRPDLVVYLDCPCAEIQRRIKLRGREFEQTQGERIAALAHLSERWMSNGAWKEIPTLVVNSGALNFDTAREGKLELTRRVVSKLKEVNAQKFAHLNGGI